MSGQWLCGLIYVAAPNVASVHRIVSIDLSIVYLYRRPINFSRQISILVYAPFVKSARGWSDVCDHVNNWRRKIVPITFEVSWDKTYNMILKVIELGNLTDVAPFGLIR